MTNSTMPATVKDAAAAIRADLKTAFPGVKFAVRKGAGTNAAWIDIAWADGPNDDMIRNITDPYTVFGSPVEGVERQRHITMAALLKAQDLIRAVLPDFEVYDGEGRWLLSARPDTVEVFHLNGWRFGGGSASAALREVADVCILNPRTGPGA